MQDEKERKKEEKKKMMVQESIYGVVKTPVRGGNKTLRQVKRLQNESKFVSIFSTLLFFYWALKAVRLSVHKSEIRRVLYEIKVL